MLSTIVYNFSCTCMHTLLHVRSFSITRVIPTNADCKSEKLGIRLIGLDNYAGIILRIIGDSKELRIILE